MPSAYQGKLRNTPIPASDAIATPPREDLPPGRPDLLAGTITRPWNDYFTAMASQLNASPYQLYGDYQTSLAASVASTDLSAGLTINEGVYWVTYLMQVIRAATVSSSLQITFTWTDVSGITQTQTQTAITGNTTQTRQQGDFLIWCAANSPVTYAITYGSVGATTMQYNSVVYLNFWYS